MSDRRRLVVSPNEVAVIVDATAEDASAEIKSARQFLASLRQTSAQPRPAHKADAHTLSARILGLAPDFFAEPKESTEVAKELARAAHHYSDVRVRVDLSRLVKRGALRRVGDGTKSSPYKYVNR